MCYLDIHEDNQLDDELMASWIRQASELPGWVHSAGMMKRKATQMHRYAYDATRRDAFERWDTLSMSPN